MTVQEVIKEFSYDDTAYGGHCTKEMRKITIQALEEVEQYRALGTPTQILERIGGLDVELGKYHCLGTVEELKEAREKQIPQKPTDIDEDANTFVCPSCGHTLIALDDMTVHQHCLICGKALKWGEEE